jgi:hypothetical protein
LHKELNKKELSTKERKRHEKNAREIHGFRTLPFLMTERSDEGALRAEALVCIGVASYYHV